MLLDLENTDECLLESFSPSLRHLRSFPNALDKDMALRACILMRAAPGSRSPDSVDTRRHEIILHRATSGLPMTCRNSPAR